MAATSEELMAAFTLIRRWLLDGSYPGLTDLYEELTLTQADLLKRPERYRQCSIGEVSRASLVRKLYGCYGGTSMTKEHRLLKAACKLASRWFQGRVGIPRICTDAAYVAKRLRMALAYCDGERQASHQPCMCVICFARRLESEAESPNIEDVPQTAGEGPRSTITNCRWYKSEPAGCHKEQQDRQRADISMSNTELERSP